MDHLDIELTPVQYEQHKTQAIEIRINGSRLQELARVAELPHAAADGQAQLAGDYASLILEDIRSRPEHFLGSPVATWFEDGDAVLMGCTCGEWGCWPLTVQIDLGETTVRWHSFRNGHRDWDLGALGPFSFERAEYESALDAIRQ